MTKENSFIQGLSLPGRAEMSLSHSMQGPSLQGRGLAGSSACTLPEHSPQPQGPMLCSGLPSLPEDGASSGQTRSTRTNCSTTPAATVRTGAPPRPWGATPCSVRAPVHSGLAGRAVGGECVCACEQSSSRSSPDPDPCPALSALHAGRCLSMFSRAL